jgi:hypothetical protein
MTKYFTNLCLATILAFQSCCPYSNNDEYYDKERESMIDNQVEFVYSDLEIYRLLHQGKNDSAKILLENRLINNYDNATFQKIAIESTFGDVSDSTRENIYNKLDIATDSLKKYFGPNKLEEMDF